MASPGKDGARPGGGGVAACKAETNKLSKYKKEGKSPIRSNQPVGHQKAKTKALVVGAEAQQPANLRKGSIGAFRTRHKQSKPQGSLELGVEVAQPKVKPHEGKRKQQEKSPAFEQVEQM